MSKEEKKEIERPPLVQVCKPTFQVTTKVEKDLDNEQFRKFLKLLKQPHGNLLFVEALFWMTKYAKFFKDLLTNNRKLDELSTMTLNEDCSVII